MNPSNAETPAVVAHPVTGEVLVDLDKQPPELLAHALVVVRERRDALAAGQKALEDELRRRLKILDRRLAVFGEWEVESTRVREADWDVAELESAIERLVADGTLRASEVADVVTRTPVASRSKAKALLGRLDGTAHDQVAAALSWRNKSQKLTVARSVVLPTGDEVKALRAAAQEAPTDGVAPASTTTSPGSPEPPRPTVDLNPQELFA
jgi:hypothetical protein